MYVGDAPLTAVYAGDLPVQRIYVGDTLSWSAQPAVLMTVEGTSFEPWVELAPGSTATVQWVDVASQTVIATGLTPTITAPDASPRQIELRCDVPGDIVTLNLGFHNGQDNGLYSLPSSYNYETQPVTNITNLQMMSGIQRFMAARTNGISQDGSLYTGPLLGGHLDFSGMTSIEYIECFMSDVSSVDLAGCDSLLRLVVEQTQVTELDLNPVRTTLLDLRVAFQQGGSLTLAPLTGPMTNLYHFCVRRQNITGMPDVETVLPAVRQLWIWNAALDLPEITVRSTDDLHSLVLSTDSPGGTPNQIDVLDVAGEAFADLLGDEPYIEAFGIGLQDIDLTGVTGLSRLYLHTNSFNEATIDAILTEVESWGTNDGILELQNNLPPSSAGAALVSALQGRGWDVSVDAGQTLLWADEFDNDATEANWVLQSGDTIDIAGGSLTWSGAADYSLLGNMAGTSLPDDFEVALGWNDTVAGGGGPGSWWGVMGRWNGTTSGVRALFRTSSTLVRIGNTINATDPSAGDTDIAGILAANVPNWDAVGPHEIRLRFVGAEFTLYFDGVAVASRNSAGLPDAANLGVGIVGQPQGRSWTYIRVYSV